MSRALCVLGRRAGSGLLFLLLAILALNICRGTIMVPLRLLNILDLSYMPLVYLASLYISFDF